MARVEVPSRPQNQNRAVSIVQDYDGDGGDTIRFGDGTFGQLPLPGTDFDVIYRIGGGTIGNVAADAINQVEASAKGVLRVTNPFPACGGNDPEPLERVRRLAPQQFRARQYRALRPKDYQDAAQTLPWVERAGTVFRWTGSWLTVFTTPDPLDSEQITIPERAELINLLNRYRMAGYESYVPDPVYVSLDLVVELCARPDAFQADVEETVLEALSAIDLPSGSRGFFNPDNFTFGQALERSELEAAIQKAPGVAGVTCVQYRVRGRTQQMVEMPDAVPVGTNEIIRCDNDPSLPERGSFKVIVRGGK
jgi:predicted phage baseplate assembly protein